MYTSNLGHYETLYLWTFAFTSPVGGGPRRFGGYLEIAYSSGTPDNQHNKKKSPTKRFATTRSTSVQSESNSKQWREVLRMSAMKCTVPTTTSQLVDISIEAPFAGIFHVETTPLHPLIDFYIKYPCKCLLDYPRMRSFI